MIELTGQPNAKNRIWHIGQREDKSITVYYTDPACGETHFVVMDSLDQINDQAAITDLTTTCRKQAEALDKIADENSGLYSYEMRELARAARGE